jgi:hypothetical protein
MQNREALKGSGIWLKIEDSVLEIIKGVIIIRKFERVTVYPAIKVIFTALRLVDEPL